MNVRNVTLQKGIWFTISPHNWPIFYTYTSLKLGTIPTFRATNQELNIRHLTYLAMPSATQDHKQIFEQLVIVILLFAFKRLIRRCILETAMEDTNV